MAKTLGARLKELRLEKKMSQAAVGDAIGVRTHSVWKYENDRQVPKSYRLGRLAKLFAEPLEALVALIPEPEAPGRGLPGRHPGDDDDSPFADEDAAE